ncbi:hypothetical protein SynRS9909_02085 [Synechococcus sp. RS9909]|uniref:hypothetical protein n=1 Tax=unclassified Synechococcus TaxID=2626047 RepID=UPI000068F61B|nr:MULTISPECIES: hypothetical protein [unclassified Synechococcus]EAQ69661.1 hypothetical protein RS9917_09506 [Synechococcus sp. RS9917]QNI80068.1 hypothetical protein SynRS9909_02085 [Synechococcus sp. RS9909]
MVTLPRVAPDEWAGDNMDPGRWKANSTAGRAVVNVLTVEPTRLRWGTPLMR